MPVLMQSVLDQDVKFNKRCKPFNKFSAFFDSASHSKVDFGYDLLHCLA